MLARRIARVIVHPALALLVAEGCIPGVMHGPRIDGGFAAGAVASHTAGPRKTRGDNGGMAYAYGPVGVNLAYGWTFDSIEGLGVLLGIHVPVPLLLGAQTDMYVQLPRRPLLGLDGGVGVTSTPAVETVMPYAQLGVLRSSGSGVYATYGALIGPDPSNVNYSGRGAGAHVPGIAFQNVNGRTTTRYFVTAIIARKRCSDSRSFCTRADDWAVASGIAVERRRRKRP